MCRHPTSTAPPHALARFGPKASVTARTTTPQDVYKRQEHGLSEREAEVLSLVVMKKTNQEIADELVLAVGTIKSHVHNLVKQTGTKNREDLIVDFWQS